MDRGAELPFPPNGLFSPGGLETLNALPVPAWVFDLDRRALAWANRAALALWGVDDAKAVRAEQFSMSDGATAQRLQDYRIAVERGETVSGPWTLVAGNRPRILDGTGTGLRFADGRWGVLVVAAPPCGDGARADRVRAVEAIRHTPTMITLFDLDGRVLFENPAAAHAFAHRADARDRFAARFAIAEDADSVRTALAHDGAYVGAHKMDSAGDGHWHALDCRRTADPVTGVPAVLVSQRDISERMEMERQVRAERDRAESYLRVAGTMMVALAPDGTIALVNDKACETLGRTEEELIGRSWFDIAVPPEDRSRVRDVHDRVVAGKLDPVEFFENQIVVRDGNRRTIVWHNATVRGADGRKGGSLSSGIDVTERKRAEQRTERNLAITRTVGAILHLSFEDRPLEEILSEALRSILSLPCFNLERRGCVFVYDESRALLRMAAHCGMGDVAVSCAEVPLGRCLCGKAAENGAPLFKGRLDEDYSCLGEKMVSHGRYCVPIRTDGRLLGVLTACVPDDTAHNGEEEEFLVLVANTLAGVIERHRAATALAAKTAELERSNRELEQFAYVASHDMREPLRMVSSYLQLIERRYRGRLDQDADEFIGFAVDGARRLQAMIADLLQYSRLGTRGKPFLPVDAKDVLDEALANLRVTLTDAEAAVEHGPLPLVTADDGQLARLFQNLIDNAVKYRHPDRPPRVRIEAEENADGWTFSVTDNGIGIEPRNYDRIFQIFQRLQPAGSGSSGTGIGLAVCKKIVERHHGRIWVDSRPEMGSTFHFTLGRLVHPG